MDKNRLISLSWGLFLASAGAAAQGTGGTEKPNVIYLLCDDMGYSDIEAYGQQMISTPNLTRMVNEGMSFTQFYASTAVSAPSRASLMTGQHTGHTKIRGNKEIQPEGQEPLDPNVETLGMLFQQNGYATGCFGKWGMGYPGSGGEPNDMGFDEFYGYNCQRQAHTYYPDYLWHNKEKVQLGGTQYSQDLIHQQALEFIRDNAAEGKPFFGYFTYTIPHAELCQPQDSIVDMYKGRFQEPNAWYDNGDYGTATDPRTQFAAMITRLDTYVGQIMDELKRLGIAENTLFIFTSDNGPHNEGGADPTFFNTEERLRGLKRALYEGGMRVPFIAWWPGTVEAGSITDLQAAGWDMMPTFVELLGESTDWRDEAMDGLSILPTLTGEGEQQVHDFLYWEFHEEGGRQAVRAGDWKLIRQNIRSGNPTLELYNIAEDPHEDNNVINANRAKADELEAIMDREHTHSDIFNFGR